jgi:hypothetical protein
MPQLLPRVLILHTGGTLGMDIKESFEADADAPQLTPLQLKKGTGGTYKGVFRLGPSTGRAVPSALLLLRCCQGGSAGAVHAMEQTLPPCLNASARSCSLCMPVLLAAFARMDT